ncbi:methyltransferase domain-containing protein [Caulobacter henricii]|uniref:Glycosyl transferase n=1 Tax=Caulobacter henricii TaxID=69395 RepID=A0A0P0NY93_9CAUL|nr:methyltransferase domain-containing protein [Caulobacter henricii]ALL12862.1 hypothetical protein AQ619_05545 [Caulobacter henricii]
MTFGNDINPDILKSIPLDRRHVLEVGCGNGRFAEAYRARNPDARYVGLELLDAKARDAASFVDSIVVGDVAAESVMAGLDQARANDTFDAVIFRGVLQDLNAPSAVLAGLRARTGRGGICVAGVPNVSHWALLQQQLKGEWPYVTADRANPVTPQLFTRVSAIKMFQMAGWTVLEASPFIISPEETEAAIRAFAPIAESLGVSSDNLRRDLSAFQWIIKAINGPPSETTTVAAIGMAKFAGVTEPRVDHPLAALASTPGSRVSWGAGSVNVPRHWPPGVFLLHRQFLNDGPLNRVVSGLIDRGWTITSDIDDDPHHWREFVESDFHAFRGVHAVTVSTEPLATMIRQWNPNVTVFPNAIAELPRIEATTPKSGPRLKVFFGALNRGGDWAGLSEAIIAAARSLADRLEFVVVHDEAFYKALPDEVTKVFHPTLPHADYMKALAGCDLALLPLADTPFNRLKSDLKFIECCAAGVVPICSPIVYGDTPEHLDIGVFADTPASWEKALRDLAADPGEVQARRERGLAYVRARRMHAQQVPLRQAYYRDLMAQRPELEAQRQARIAAARPAR